MCSIFLSGMKRVQGKKSLDLIFSTTRPFLFPLSYSMGVTVHVVHGRGPHPRHPLNSPVCLIRVVPVLILWKAIATLFMKTPMNILTDY